MSGVPTLRPDGSVENRTTPTRVVALLGAESTGKTALAMELAQTLQACHGLRCTWVSEWLRHWCEQQGRTPRPDEQAAIAAEQTRRIEVACQGHDIVVADTTALMTAIYSRLLFQDDSLMDTALHTQRLYAVTLVTANDLPWQADGIQRDGAHVRGPVRQMVIAQLGGAGLAYGEVTGTGTERLASALRHVQAAIAPVWKPEADRNRA